MALGFGDLRKGATIELDGEPYQVLDYTRTKMQQRAPVIRLRLRGIRSGRTLERTFQGYDIKLTRAQVEKRPAQYIYLDGDHYYFMDTESFEQYPLTVEQLGDSLNYLKEQSLVEMVFYRGEPISLELPNYVELAVVETPPAVKGNTAQGGTKPARLETGIRIQVPFFVNTGEVIRVDTRTCQYLERAG